MARLVGGAFTLKVCAATYMQNAMDQIVLASEANDYWEIGFQSAKFIRVVLGVSLHSVIQLSSTSIECFLLIF
jgi:hypothetical protein